MLREIARGCLLVGAAASIAAVAFCLLHLGKNDPWGLAAAAICLVTWAVSVIYWAFDYGVRLAAKHGDLGGSTRARNRPGRRYRISVIGALAVILSCAVLFGLLRPVLEITGELWRSHIAPQVFMTLRRGELYERLSSGDSEDANYAVGALQRRGRVETDRAVLAAAFVDARLPIHTRHDVGLLLALYPSPQPSPVLSVVAGELNSKDPEWQVMAAEVLSQMAPDSPTKFELAFSPSGGRWRSDWEKYRPNVELLRRWWEMRSRRDQ
jgi:hypothetical protein